VAISARLAIAMMSVAAWLQITQGRAS